MQTVRDWSGESRGCVVVPSVELRTIAASTDSLTEGWGNLRTGKEAIPPGQCTAHSFVPSARMSAEG